MAGTIGTERQTHHPDSIVNPICTMKTVIGIAIALSLMGCASPDNPERRMAERLAVPSDDYPLAGFWKEQGANTWGLAIAPFKDGLYSISFCGPGGCFEPGTYRPNSKIYGDKKYRVISVNTIELSRRNGQVGTYYRFKSRTSSKKFLR